MPDIVLALHPAFVRQVPARSREERAGLVRIETPVRLRSRDAGDLVPVLDLPATAVAPARRLLAGSEGLWEAVADGNGKPVEEDALKGWLSGGECPDSVRDALDLRFDGTPLAAHGNGIVTDPGRLRRAFRGEVDDLVGTRRLSHDGRDDARAALAAYLHDEVALCEGHLLVRARPLATVDVWASRGVALAAGRGDPDFRVLPARPESLDAAMALARDPRGPDPDVLAGWRALERHWPDEGEEVRWALNAWSGPLRRLLDHCLDQPWFDRGERAQVVEVRDTLRGSEVAALTGAAGRVSPHRPFAALVRAAAFGIQHGTGRVEKLDLRGLHGRLVRNLAPRLATTYEPVTVTGLPAR